MKIHQTLSGLLVWSAF